MASGKTILRNTLLIGALLLAGRLAMLARELVVAQDFGRGDEVEAFVIATLVPLLLLSVVGTAFGYAFVPTYIRVREASGREAAQRVVRSVSAWTLLALAAGVAALTALGPWLLPLLAGNFDAPKLALAERLFVALAPFTLLSGLAAIWTAVLNAEESFALPALAAILEPAAGIAALVVAGPALGIYALALGAAVGAGLQAAMLAAALHARGVAWRPRLLALDAESVQVLRQCAPMVLSSLIAGGVALVDNAMAATLEPGSVAALTYGRRLVDALVGVAALALGTAVFPYFSRLVARADWQQCRESLMTFSAVVFAAALAFTLAIGAFSGPLVAALFERGRFTAEDTAIVSQIQLLYALQMPFFVAGAIGNRMVSALQRNGFFVYSSLGLLGLKAAFNAALIPSLGVPGIALATSAAYWVSSSVTLVYAARALSRSARS